MKEKHLSKAARDFAKDRGWHRFTLAMKGLPGGCQSASVLEKDYGTLTKETWRKCLRDYKNRWIREESERKAMEEEHERKRRKDGFPFWHFLWLALISYFPEQPGLQTRCWTRIDSREPATLSNLWTSMGNSGQ